MIPVQRRNTVQVDVGGVESGGDSLLDLEDEPSPEVPAGPVGQEDHGPTVERLVAEGVDFFVVRVDGDAVGCGGILFVDDAYGRYGELKRMFVRPESRGLGLGRALLERLVEQARSRDISIVRLETGIHQGAAIGLYEAEGFRPIAPFGPYRDDPLTRCYELRLR